MRIVGCTLAILCITVTAVAQDEAIFKILSYAPGVTIDGVEPEIGANISGPDKRIRIPNGAYLGVIGKDGSVFKIFKRTLSAGEVVASRPDRNRLSPTGAIARPVPDFQIWPNSTTIESIMSDSIFVVWQPNYSNAEDSVTVIFKNMFDEPLTTLKTTDKYAVVNIKDMWVGEDAILFKLQGRYKQLAPQPVTEKSKNSDNIPVRTGSMQSAEYLFTEIGTPRSKKNDIQNIEQIRADLRRLPNTPDKVFLESALYKLYDFPFDSNMCLYRIMKNKRTTSDPILSKYYESMFEENNLKTVNLD